MKKIILSLFFLFLFSFHATYAGGGMTHMYIAQLAIDQLPDPELRNLLRNNMNDYLVGSYYPDSGYIKGARYGEDSHWDEFVYAFSDYINKTYKYPTLQNPRLVAFLFGIATHRVSDEVIHHDFYAESSKHDFNNNRSKAETYGDIGIDLLLNIDKNQWQNYPNVWWIPVNHLVAVYRSMGKDYTAQEIIMANSIIKYAGHGERLISPPAYPILQLRMPWTASHYLNWPGSGVKADAVKVANYQTKLWQRLTNKQRNIYLYPSHKAHDISNLPIMVFAEKILTSGAVVIPVQTNTDGSVELREPVIKNLSKIESLVREFVLNIYKW